MFASPESIKGNFLMEILVEKGRSVTLMAEPIKENGRRDFYQDMAFSLGLTETDMRDSIQKG
jgi:hypothetical protein